MSDQEVLNVEKRETRGTAKARQMRREGKIPAVLYGHGKENVSLIVDAGEVSLALRHKAKLVALKGGVEDTAIFKKIQWDTFYNHVLHIDFARVDAKEMVPVKLRLQLRGVAPGTKMGGTVEQLARSVEFECPADSIPEGLELSINELELDQTLTAADLDLPTGAKLTGEPDQVLVTCSVVAEKAPEEEDGAPAADGAEPEVIGEKKEEGEGDS